MVIYENLAVYKSSFDLCVYYEKIVKNFDKGHKFAIGADLKNNEETHKRKEYVYSVAIVELKTNIYVGYAAGFKSEKQ